MGEHMRAQERVVNPLLPSYMSGKRTGVPTKRAELGGTNEQSLLVPANPF